MRKRRELRLSSRMDSLRTIEEFSERISDEYFLNDSYFGNILTSLTEAVKNAIIHGNKLDELKWVFVLLEEKTEGLLFTVIDQGDGYDYQHVLEGKLEENAGRGIVMIRSLADEVNILEKGRVITLLFRISGIDQNVAQSRISMLSEYEKVIKMLERKDME
jgi:serine/threonine-protein kinase RsbW